MNRKAFRQAVTRFESAVRAHEMRGSQPPEDWEGIERRYHRAKATLLLYGDQVKE